MGSYLVPCSLLCVCVCVCYIVTRNKNVGPCLSRVRKMGQLATTAVMGEQPASSVPFFGMRKGQ